METNSFKKTSFSKTIFGFLKMDKNKCPKLTFENTFWKNLFLFYGQKGTSIKQSDEYYFYLLAVHECYYILQILLLKCTKAIHLLTIDLEA